ncbi:Dam family site-specific DNA-(adenine-N6)-methyltransferase [Candidatus Bathyarchaeota archaeon]|nr:Dam family site-specific DNA-(adenine-N6)-methyltransferase [Candidatus Bathyarchaeota archaeon]
MMKPILKWAGGKRQIIDNIISYFPKDYKSRRYHEPFFGGGAVFFKLEQTNGTINDINKRLINFYKIVRDKPDELIRKTLGYKYNEKEYYDLRDTLNQGNIDDVEEASIFLYLNKTCFNGLYRVNSKNQFNVPFGKYKNPTIVPKRRIRKASELLKDVEILCTDFEYLYEGAKKGDLCYFDPPYQPVSPTSNFTSYSADGFDINDQKRLFDLCVHVHKNQVFFVLSNSAAIEITEMYEGYEEFTLRSVDASRSINSDASKRGIIEEQIITNVPKKQWYKFRFTNFR